MITWVEALYQLDYHEETHRPTGGNVLYKKLLLRHNQNNDGSVRHNARLVVCVYGEDGANTDCVSHLAKYIIINILFSIFIQSN